MFSEDCGVTCTEWRRLIGCLKLQVIFCQRATNYRALLWKVMMDVACGAWVALRYCNTLPHTATHCDTLQHTATHCNTWCGLWSVSGTTVLQHTATHCNTLKYTSNTAIPGVACGVWVVLQYCNKLQLPATHCNTLQSLPYHVWLVGYEWHYDTTTHCNTPQHTATTAIPDVACVAWEALRLICRARQTVPRCDFSRCVRGLKVDPAHMFVWACP